MLDNRMDRRRRVCLEAQAVAGPGDAPVNLRVRTLSAGGLELHLSEGEALPGDPETGELAVRIVGDEREMRRVRIVWRRFERYGLAFLEGSRPTDDAVPGRLQRLLRLAWPGPRPAPGLSRFIRPA